VTYVKVHGRARLELRPSPDRAKMMGELGSSLSCKVSATGQFYILLHSGNSTYRTAEILHGITQRKLLVISQIRKMKARNIHSGS